MEVAEITESTFQRICQSTGWDIDWPADYFKKSRPIYEVFHDLIEPQGYGFFRSDPRLLPDIFNGLQQHLPLDDIVFGDQIQYVADSLTFPYEPIPRYQAITLSHDGTKENIACANSRLLLRRVVRIASKGKMTIMRSADSFFNEDDEYDKYDFYLVVPAGVTAPQLAPFGYDDLKQSDDDIFLSTVTRPAATEYFYEPYITTNCIPAKAGEEVGSIDVLAYDDRPANYASRVLPGQTLAEAIGSNFKKDFQYHGACTIADYRSKDPAIDKSADRLPRIKVHVQVEPFDTAALKVMDKKLQWQTTPDNVFAYYGLGTNIHAEPVKPER